MDHDVFRLGFVLVIVSSATIVLSILVELDSQVHLGEVSVHDHVVDDAVMRGLVDVHGVEVLPSRFGTV